MEDEIAAAERAGYDRGWKDARMESGSIIKELQAVINGAIDAILIEPPRVNLREHTHHGMTEGSTTTAPTDAEGL